MATSSTAGMQYDPLTGKWGTYVNQGQGENEMVQVFVPAANQPTVNTVANFDPAKMGLDQQTTGADLAASAETGTGSAGTQTGWSKSLGGGRTQQYGMNGEDLGITEDKNQMDYVKTLGAMAALATGVGALAGGGAAGSAAALGGEGSMGVTAADMAAGAGTGGVSIGGAGATLGEGLAESSPYAMSGTTTGLTAPGSASTSLFAPAEGSWLPTVTGDGVVAGTGMTVTPGAGLALTNGVTGLGLDAASTGVGLTGGTAGTVGAGGAIATGGDILTGGVGSALTGAGTVAGTGAGTAGTVAGTGAGTAGPVAGTGAGGIGGTGITPGQIVGGVAPVIANAAGTGYAAQQSAAGAAQQAAGINTAAGILAPAYTEAAKLQADAQTQGAATLAAGYTGAADQASKGYLQSGELQTAGLNKASGDVAKTLADQQALQQPYQAAGTSALNTLSAGLAPGGQYNTPFTSEMATNSDAEKFAQQQAQAAMSAKMAAGGNNLSAAAIQGAGTLAAGIGSQYQGQAFNQWLAQNNMSLGALQNMVATGQTSTAQLATALANAGVSQANIDQAIGQVQGNAALGSQKALAEGTLGAAGATSTGQIGSAGATAQGIMGAAGTNASAAQQSAAVLGGGTVQSGNIIGQGTSNIGNQLSGMNTLSNILGGSGNITTPTTNNGVANTVQQVGNTLSSTWSPSYSLANP